MIEPMNGNGDELTTQWLAARLGVGPERLNAMRRAGEILGVRRPGASDYSFPAWQWDEGCKPLPLVPRLIQTARQAGMSDERLDALLTSKTGLTGSGRLVDALREGRDEYVLDAVRAAAARGRG